MVEAAIVLPVLLLVLFGILEFGLMFRTALTISDATRSGARVAAAQPRLDGFHTSAAAAVSGALSAAGVPDDQVGMLVVYRADPTTGGLRSGGTTDAQIEGCTTDCWKFRWNTATSRYEVLGATPSWPASRQYACGIESQTDYLGVYVKATHEFLSGFFRDEQTLTERTVMRLEPLPLSDECKP